MNPITSELISTYIPEINIDFYRDFFNFVESIDYPEFEVGFLNIVENDNLDPNSILSLINNNIFLILADILKQHGIYPHEDYTNIFNLFKIAKAYINDIPYFELNEVVGNILDSDDNDIDKLVDLLNEISCIDQVISLEAISDVSGNLIDNIKLLYIENISNDVAEDNIPEISKDRIEATAKRLKALFEINNRSTVVDAIKSGMLIDMSFKTYLTSLWDEIKQYDDKSIASDIMAMAIISSDFYTNPLESIKYFLGLDLLDAKKGTNVNKLMLDISQKVLTV